MTTPAPRDAPPRALDSTLDEVVGDLEAWLAVLRAVLALAGREVGLQGGGGMSLRQVLALIPEGHTSVVALEAALAGLGRG